MGLTAIHLTALPQYIYKQFNTIMPNHRFGCRSFMTVIFFVTVIVISIYNQHTPVPYSDAGANVAQLACGFTTTMAGGYSISEAFGLYEDERGEWQCDEGRGWIWALFLCFAGVAMLTGGYAQTIFTICAMTTLAGLSCSKAASKLRNVCTCITVGNRCVLIVDRNDDYR